MRSILEVTDRDGITQYVPYAAITHFESYVEPHPREWPRPAESVLHLVGGAKIFAALSCDMIRTSFELDSR